MTPTFPEDVRCTHDWQIVGEVHPTICCTKCNAIFVGKLADLLISAKSEGYQEGVKATRRKLLKPPKLAERKVV